MRTFFLFFTFLFSRSVFAQQATNSIALVLSNISERKGLSDNHVKSVLKEVDNFTWIGTPDGLNLMDGSTARIFRHQEKDSSSLSSSHVLNLAPTQ